MSAPDDIAEFESIVNGSTSEEIRANAEKMAEILRPTPKATDRSQGMGYVNDAPLDHLQDYILARLSGY